MYTDNDTAYMAAAIRLAWLGRYSTHPNPRVGCVLVRDNKIVGQGWHQQAGKPHAEINALQMAGGDAKGATAYVTLEPCCHHGKTPPCTKALISAGVSTVIAADHDPNPQVAGNGLRLLNAAGINVKSGLLQTQAAELNRGFLKRMRIGRPFVRCKLAMSMDGRTAMASGESKWITQDNARFDVHRLRAQSSAIMTGIGTVLHDDPRLNVRLHEQDRIISDNIPMVAPTRVVLDTQLRIPHAARLLKSPGKTLIVTASTDQDRIHSLQQHGAQILHISRSGVRNDECIDLEKLMDHLATFAINEILLEAGARLCGAMLTAKLIDELVIYMAPHIMGDGAMGLFHLPQLKHMADRIELVIEDVRTVGTDLRITAKPQIS